MDNACDGVIECTALVLAENCAEFEGRLTLFGILDEIRPGEDGEASFVIYAKFEGCEHAAGAERRVRVLVSDEDGEILLESEEYSVWFDSTEEPVTLVAAFDLPEALADTERILWIEAVLDEETVSQTAVRVRDRYNV